MNQTKSRILFVAISVIALAIGIWSFKQISTTQTAPKGYPGLSKNFTLTSDKGPVSLSDFKGKAVVIFFGYTSCPDICPTTLVTMAKAIRALPEDQQPLVRGLFITIDPERDTAEKLAAYTSHFHPQITGLTGSGDEIRAVAGQLYVVYNRVELEGSEAGYAMDHSSTLYVVGPDGIVKDMVSHSNSPDNLITTLKTVLDE